MSFPAIFLDRDGVLVEDCGHVFRPEDLRVLPGVPQALKLLSNCGFQLIVVTNQAGIAKGLYTEEDFNIFTVHLQQTLEAEGTGIDATYFCPHHPTEGGGSLRRKCQCRKPAPGMLLQAARDRDLDLSASYIVGDKISDIEAGKSAGVGTAILVGEMSSSSLPTVQPDHSAIDLLDASSWVLNRELKNSTRR